MPHSATGAYNRGTASSFGAYVVSAPPRLQAQPPQPQPPQAQPRRCPPPSPTARSPPTRRRRSSPHTPSPSPVASRSPTQCPSPTASRSPTPSPSPAPTAPLLSPSPILSPSPAPTRSPPPVKQPPNPSPTQATVPAPKQPPSLRPRKRPPTRRGDRRSLRASRQRDQRKRHPSADAQYKTSPHAQCGGECPTHPAQRQRSVPDASPLRRGPTPRSDAAVRRRGPTSDAAVWAGSRSACATILRRACHLPFDIFVEGLRGKQRHFQTLSQSTATQVAEKGARAPRSRVGFPGRSPPLR